MALSDIISVTISTSGAGVTQAGFGTPLIVGHINGTFAGVQEFTSLSALATALDAAMTTVHTAHPIYLAATSLLAQSPRVSSFKVARLTTAPDRKLKVTPVRATTGDVYSILITDIDGVAQTASFTVASTQTVAAVCTGLHSAIEALTNKVAATDGTTYLTIDSDVTYDYFYAQVSLVKVDGTVGTPGVDFHVTEETAAIAQDLVDYAAMTVTDDDFYGLIVSDRKSAPQLKQIAGWVETQSKLTVLSTMDSRCITTGATTGFPMYDLKAAAYTRCLAFYSNDDRGYLDAAVIGKMLPMLPGSDTWAYQQLSGPAADVLSETQLGYITGQYGCYYSALLGVACTNGGTYGGRAPSGTYIDIVWGRDQLKARMEENVVTAFLGHGVKMTQGGVNKIVAALRSALLSGQRDGFIAMANPTDTSLPGFSVSAPAIEDVSSADRLNRLLAGVTFAAYIQGAIQSVQVTGSLSA
jgi:hypothetical protein